MDNERLLTAMQNILDNGLDADSFFELREAAAEYQPESPTPQIIRTVEELEALDPDTVILEKAHFLARVKGFMMNGNPQALLPAVVIAPGSQLRAAREALGGA